VLDGKHERTNVNLGDTDDLRSGRIMVDEGNSVSEAVVDKLLCRRFSLEGFGPNCAETGVGAISGDVDGDSGCDTSSILEADEELAIPQRVCKVEEDGDCMHIHGRVVGLSGQFQVSAGVRGDGRKQDTISFAVLVVFLRGEIFDRVFGGVLYGIVECVVVGSDKPASGERGETIIDLEDYTDATTANFSVSGDVQQALVVLVIAFDVTSTASCGAELENKGGRRRLVQTIGEQSERISGRESPVLLVYDLIGRVERAGGDGEVGAKLVVELAFIGSGISKDGQNHDER
jgi:hypothetical protein